MSSSGPLAQLVEHFPFKEGVIGSNPIRLTIITYIFLSGGYLIVISGIHFFKLAILLSLEG